MFLFRTNANLRDFQRHTDSRFRGARCASPLGSIAPPIDAHRGGETRCAVYNLKLLRVLRGKKSPPLVFATVEFCRRFTCLLLARHRCLRTGMGACGRNPLAFREPLTTFLGCLSSFFHAGEHDFERGDRRPSVSAGHTLETGWAPGLRCARHDHSRPYDAMASRAWPFWLEFRPALGRTGFFSLSLLGFPALAAEPARGWSRVQKSLLRRNYAFDQGRFLVVRGARFRGSDSAFEGSYRGWW
jgi:hypothetical protein